MLVRYWEKRTKIYFERIIGQLRLWCKIVVILEICKHKKFLQDLKTLRVSCLISFYLLCSDQANDSTANLLHFDIYLFREICEGELAKLLFMIGICHYLWL